MGRVRVKQRTHYYKKRRRFCRKKQPESNAETPVVLNQSAGNFNTKNASSPISLNISNCSASSKKVIDITLCEKEQYYRISYDRYGAAEWRKQRLCSTFSLSCSQCYFKHDFSSSKRVNNAYDVNKRIVYAMRSVGQSYAGIETFCTMMNMPKCMRANNYDKLVKVCSSAAQSVAEEVMQQAVTELRKEKCCRKRF